MGTPIPIVVFKEPFTICRLVVKIMTSVITTIIGESGINGISYPYIDPSIICSLSTQIIAQLNGL